MEYNEDEEDPKKVLDEEWEFLAKNWYWYIAAFFMGLLATAIIVALFLSIMSMIYNG